MKSLVSVVKLVYATKQNFTRWLYYIFLVSSNQTSARHRDFYPIRRFVLKAVSKKTENTATGYRREVTIYECESCRRCPYKKACIKGNNCKTPLKDRNKKLSVSRKLEEKHAECLERITSEYGTQLRMNRSIQAEGSFANVKEDMNFRRYLYRGKENVLAQSTLLAIGFDINKLHHKIMSKRTGTHLFAVKNVS